MAGYVRTAILLAGLTALFIGIGYVLGGRQGMVIAFLLACGTNLWAWWNSDRVVLSMHNAEPITPAQAQAWARGTATDWALEAFAIGRDDAYGRLPPPTRRYTYRLTPAYIDMSVRDVRLQLSRAGVRLASVLNGALGRR